MAWDNSDRSARLPKDWHARRQRVLRRDGYRCKVMKGEGEIRWRCSNPAREVDHINPGDDHRDTNLRAICTTCHKAKSSAEGVAAQPRRAREQEPHPGLINP